jgi:hypothetical protein
MPQAVKHARPPDRASGTLPGFFVTRVCDAALLLCLAGKQPESDRKQGVLSMSLFISVGGFFTQQPGTTVTWSTSFGSGFGLDRRIVIQAPNISDDILGVVRLNVTQQSVVASNNGLAYLVTINNPSARPVRYNLNVQDPL